MKTKWMNRAPMSAVGLVIFALFAPAACTESDVAPAVDEPTPAATIVGGDVRVVEAGEGSLTVVVASTDTCTVAVGGDGWLQLAEDGITNSGGQYRYPFRFTPNTAAAQRTATVVFAQRQRPEVAATLTVHQNGTAPAPVITMPEAPPGGFVFDVRQWIRLRAEVSNATGCTWSLDGATVGVGPYLLHVERTPGTYVLRLTATNDAAVNVAEVPVAVRSRSYDASVAAVFDFRPAPGQFVNVLPAYGAGDTQATMNAKALAALRNGGLSLGGFGGYVVMGFDHVLMNHADGYDFRIRGNALPTWSEAGVVQVAVDANANGLPDDEWFELAGAAHTAAGAIRNYVITYTLEAREPMRIRWVDNAGAEGVIEKNASHAQNYFPDWLAETSYTLTGTRLPQDGIYDTSGNGSFWVSMPFAYGYVDNCMETDECARLKLEWAVDRNGQPASLKGVDFVRVYTGLHAMAGWLGEVSTEIMGFEEIMN
jgi:hypothetical protein